MNTDTIYLKINAYTNGCFCSILTAPKKFKNVLEEWHPIR